jgi:hypothetical protein
MEIKKRIKNALLIAEEIKNGQLDPNNKYDLLLHLSDAIEQAEKLSIYSIVTRLDSLKVGDKFKYNLNDEGMFEVVAEKQNNWIVTKRMCGRYTGGFPEDKVYPV